MMERECVLSKDRTGTSLCRDAQREVFEALFIPVLRRLRRWGASREDAEELATDTLRIVIRKLDEGLELIGFRYAYAIGVGRRLFFRLVKSQKLVPELALVVSGTSDSIAIHPIPEIELDEIIEHHRNELLDGLSERQLVILRRVENGDPTSGLASDLNMSEGNVRLELFRARRGIAENIRVIARTYHA